jgi:hypothetical protein
MYAIGLFLLLAVAQSDQSQKAKESLFRIGMSHQEMVELFGEPQSYLDVDSQLHISRSDYLKREGNCLCRPLYSRKTPRNEYEIAIFEKVDDSTSRLHPTTRIEEVRFTLDRDLTGEELLTDIVEAKQECDGKCASLPEQFPGDKEVSRPGSNIRFSFFYRKDGKLAFMTMFNAK